MVDNQTIEFEPSRQNVGPANHRNVAVVFPGPNTIDKLLEVKIPMAVSKFEFETDVEHHLRFHMLRSICAVVVSVITWFLVATVGNLLIRLLLPGYAAVEVSMNFTLPMEIARLVLGLIASLFAGVLCAAIAHSGSHAAKVVAGIMVVLFIPAHYLLWDRFPVWYHLFFLLSLAPAVLLGALLPKRVSQSDEGFA
jgi:hypothetical protein